MDKRQQLLSATRYLLAHRGFHGFSVKQVAERAGVATGTLYLYFKDREDLVLQLYRSIVEEIARALFSQHSSDQPLRAQYEQFSRSLWQLYAERPEILLCKNQFDHLPPEVIQRQYADLRALMMPLLDFLQQGREEGAMKDLPDEALFILGFDFYATLARRQTMGLIRIDEPSLQQLIGAGWDALAA